MFMFRKYSKALWNLLHMFMQHLAQSNTTQYHYCQCWLNRQGEEEYINIQYYSLHFDVCFPKLTKKQKQWNKDSNSKPIDRVRCLMTWVVVRVGHILLACFFTYIDRTVQIAHTLKLASTKRLAPTVAAIWQQIRSSQKLSYVHKIHT